MKPTKKQTDLIKKVVAFLREIKDKYEITDEMTEGNGAIFYANGNDGTDFDWEWNDRTCEIGYSTPNGEWVIKSYVSKNGNADAYVFPHGEPSPIAVESKTIFTRKEARDFKDLLYAASDAVDAWNSTFDKLFGEEVVA